MFRRLRDPRILLVLALCIVKVPSAYAGDPNENWVEVRSPHFTVLSNAGERNGRHVAAQFENIRALFQAAFPKARIDAGKPTIAFALKNENSLKLLLPSYGLNNKEKHIGGLYHMGPDKNFALVRTDITESESNYHALYHEYTHAFLHLNFRGLPLWLDEGLAEFYGNTGFDAKYVIYGGVDLRQLLVLRPPNQLIPIPALVAADQTSPFYNAQEHAGMFYTESWALVHYFLVSEEVRQQKLIPKFLTLLQSSDDPVEAANESFGDLSKLARHLQAYASQNSFSAIRLPLQTNISEDDFTVRKLAPVEVLVQRADFLLSTGHREEALVVLHEAESKDAKFPALHDSLGYYHYLQSAYDESEREYQQALDSDPSDAMAFFYKAHVLLRKHGYTKETTPQIRNYLNRVVALSPDFAPAHAFLCMADMQDADTRPKAINEAERAMELEPGNLVYYTDFGKALLRNGRFNEAKLVSEHAQRVAATVRDRAIATSFAQEIAKNEPTSSHNDAPGHAVDAVVRGSEKN